MIYCSLINRTGKKLDYVNYISMLLILPCTLSASNNIRQPEQAVDASVANGSVDSHQSISELLDSCVLYYYAVAHKYITMVSNIKSN